MPDVKLQEWEDEEPELQPRADQLQELLLEDKQPCVILLSMEPGGTKPCLVTI